MSSYDDVVGGKLKLKGKALDVKAGGIKKKKKNNKSQDQILTLDDLPAGLPLLLGFMIDRMQCYLQKIVGLRSIVGLSKKEVERVEKEIKDHKEKFSNGMTQLREQVSNLSATLKKLNAESAEKDKRIETAESQVALLQKKAANLLLEYDRLLEDTQNLENQALGFKN